MFRRMIATAALSALLAPTPALAGDGHGHEKPVVEQVDNSGFSGTAARWGSLYIASQPDEAALARMAQSGVVTVINLRTPAEMERLDFDEPAEVERLGMSYVHVPLGGADHPHTPAALDSVAQAIAAADGAPVLLHCASSGRASHMFAAWLTQEQDMPLNDAIVEARKIGLAKLAVENLLGTTFDMSLPADAKE